MDAIEKSAKRWFYILTYGFMSVTCLIGVIGIRLLFKLRGELPVPQLALAGAAVFALTLLGGILTLLTMLFYDPKRRVGRF
jgi:hypothetical protein